MLTSCAAANALMWADFVPPANAEFRSTFNPDTFDPINQACVCNRMFDTSVFGTPSLIRLAIPRTASPRFALRGTSKRTRPFRRTSACGRASIVQLRFEMLNVFNRHYFGGVDLNMNNATFGNIRTATRKPDGPTRCTHRVLTCKYFLAALAMSAAMPNDYSLSITGGQVQI
jgi:hypothetical protein